MASKRRLTWKFGGDWFCVTSDGRTKRMPWWSPKQGYRVLDRMFIGPDTGRNHW